MPNAVVSVDRNGDSINAYETRGRTFDWLVFVFVFVFFFSFSFFWLIGVEKSAWLRASGNAGQKMKINSRSDRVTFPIKRVGTSRYRHLHTDLISL